MTALGWGLIALGVVFAAITAWQLHTGVIVDRSIVTSRAKDPKGFRDGELFLGCYAAALVAGGVVLLAVA